jgi:hypothetical protein
VAGRPGGRFDTLGVRLFGAEPFDQNSPSLAVLQQARAPVGAVLVGNLEVLAPRAAIGAPQRRIVLAPRMAAARAAGRLFRALLAGLAGRAALVIAAMVQAALTAATLARPVAVIPAVIAAIAPELVALVGGPWPLENSPFQKLTVPVRLTEPWQDGVRRYLFNVGGLHPARGETVAEHSERSLRRNLADLSDEAHPTAADVTLVCRLARQINAPLVMSRQHRMMMADQTSWTAGSPYLLSITEKGGKLMA